MIHERQELVARALVLAERTEHGAGGGAGVLLFDAAHHHAEVPGFADHPHPHRVDSFLIENRESIKDAMLSAETYTASLKSKADAIDRILGKADEAVAGLDSGVDKITNVLPGFVDGKADELFEKMRSLRELADTYKKKAATFMDEGRKMLSDVSESANNMTRKIDPAALPAPPRRPQQKRQ